MCVIYVSNTHLIYHSNNSLIILIQNMTKYKYNKTVLFIYYSVPSGESICLT